MLGIHWALDLKESLTPPKESSVRKLSFKNSTSRWQNCIFFLLIKRCVKDLAQPKKLILKFTLKYSLWASLMPAVLTCKSAKVKLNSQQQKEWGGTEESYSKQSNF